MEKITRRTVLGIAAAAPFLSRAAFAQADWPTKPVTLLLPYGTGGGADVTARAIAAKLTEMLGQPVIVENRPGGNAVIGANATLAAPADGYTIFWDSVGQITNQLFVKDLTFNYAESFVPVSWTARFPGVIAVRNDFPSQTIGEFIEYVKANPEKVTCGTHSTLSMGHLAMELLQKQAGIKLQHVPYKGGTEAVRDMMGGQIDAVIISTSTIRPAMEAQKARILALTGGERVEVYPDVPTLDESGFPGFNMDDWAGVFYKAGVPAEIVAKASAAIAEACKAPEVVAPIAALGTVLVGSTPDEFKAYLDAQRNTVVQLVTELNLKPAQ